MKLALLSLLILTFLVGCSGGDNADPGPAPAFGSKAGSPGSPAGAGGAGTPSGFKSGGETK